MIEPDDTLAAVILERVRDLGWAVAASQHPGTLRFRAVAVKDQVTHQVDADTLYAAVVQLAVQVGIDLG